MEVKVQTTCGRCARNEEKTFSLEGAQELQERKEVSDEKAKEVPTLINDMLGPDHPDVVVAIKDGDHYVVKTLKDLCVGERSCTSTVSRLVRELFKQAAPRKPRKKKDKPVEATTPKE